MLTPVDRKIGELQQLDPPALRILWSKAFGRPSPKKMSRDLLLCAVAYQDQEKAEGGLSKAALKRLINPANANGNIVRPPAPRLKPGTRLVREWHGEVHQVTVLDDGYDYRGERYASLSRIAREITGTRWSGPFFFGLRRLGDRPGGSADGR